MLAFFAVFIDRQPVRVGVVHILMACVWVSACNDIHAQLPAAVRYVAEGIHISQPLAAVVQGNLGRVKGHASARIQNRGIRMDSLEIVKPELHVVIAGVVFDKTQLGPTHGAVVPGCSRGTVRSR